MVSLKLVHLYSTCVKMQLEFGRVSGCRNKPFQSITHFAYSWDMDINFMNSICYFEMATCHIWRGHQTLHIWPVRRDDGWAEDGMSG